MSEELKSEVKKRIFDVGEGKSFEGVDLDNTEFVRGKTPDDIEEKCLKLCKEYLSDNWCQQTIDTIEVRRITGGMMNQIYYCGIREQKAGGNTPQDVVIKFNGDFRPMSDPDDNAEIQELVVALVFSQNNLGPKVLGVFEGGQIQKFYKHRPFAGENQKNPEFIQKVFRSLARIHSLEVPIKRNARQMLNQLDKALEEPKRKNPIQQMIEDTNCEIFSKHDVKTEIIWMKGVVQKVKSPEVFCHLDFRSTNLLITEPNDELVVCDFDLSGYSYRGNDFVFMMREWGLKHFFAEMNRIDLLPLGSELKPFIEIYVDECQQIYGKSFSENEINSVDHILKEVKVFLLLSYLFFGTMHLTKEPPKQGDNGNKGQRHDPKFIMDMVSTSYKNYITVKGILEEQKLFD